MVQSSSRINLSTRFHLFYKYGTATFIVLLMMALLYYYFLHESFFWIVFYFGAHGYVLYLWFKANALVYQVQFDEDFVYVNKGKVEIQIPLANVKDIELKSVLGLWRIDLVYADVLGNHFYCKPSMLYPFNFKKKEKVIDLFWSYVENAKRKEIIISNNSLMS
jgi:hypothetical protein